MKTDSIWIVHNRLHMLMLIRNTFIVQGCPEVKCFNNSFDVIELLLEGKSPDIIVAEDRLTGMSGNDLLTLARNINDQCNSILLISPDADHYSIQHHTIVEGAAGFHESLLQTMQVAAHEEFYAISRKE